MWLYNTNDGNVRYKVRAVDEDSDSSVFSDFISTSSLLTNPDNPPQNTVEALTFSLEQNYPNPFNPTTEIRYSIPNNSFVTLKVYNAIGQIVAELVNNEYKESGSHNVVFDGSNLASGIYFYKLEAANFVDTRKMVLVK